MATITIHNLDQDLKARLHERAAQHGRSMEEEARDILQAVLAADTKSASGAVLVQAIRSRVERFGGVELELPKRSPVPESSDSSGPPVDR